MTSLGKIAEKDSLGFNIGIVFETGNWDDHALRTYNGLVRDSTWKYHNLFESITPKTKLGALGLQAGRLDSIRDPKTGEGAQQQ